MLFIRYEYDITDKVNGTYQGSFTLRADADKTVVEKLKAHQVETFEVDNIK